MKEDIRFKIAAAWLVLIAVGVSSLVGYALVRILQSPDGRVAALIFATTACAMLLTFKAVWIVTKP